MKATFAVALTAVLLPVVLSQDGAQGPIFVPFEYDDDLMEPIYASIVDASTDATTFALIDGPRTAAIEPGPATLVQAGATGSMIYIDQAKPTATYTVTTAVLGFGVGVALLN
ncbi:hypothetical protein CVT24_007685 [Panaeolus cyanescens]|uniref:Uncharacterized protein n=1 Tax=Panaeolus cyanescens TaxID=181874 RepID=A0A409VRR4_9AGAR|nr:hypothetical protein CVT24_007685 [Panaeolus cyanescens]